MSQHRWARRVLVTYSSEEAPELARLRAEIQRRRCEWENRRLVLETLTSPGDSFSMQLVGYDGGTKHTSTQPDLQTVFDIIDTMPMRRAEMPSDQPC